MAGPGHCGSLLQPSMPARGGRGTHWCPRCRSGYVAVVSLPMCNMYLQDRQLPGTHAAFARRDLVEGTCGRRRARGRRQRQCPRSVYAYGYDLESHRGIRPGGPRSPRLDSPLGGYGAGCDGYAGRRDGHRISGTLGQRHNADLILFRGRGPGRSCCHVPVAPCLVIRKRGRPIADGLPDYRELDLAPPMTTREVDGVIVRAPVQHPAQRDCARRGGSYNLSDFAKFPRERLLKTGKRRESNASMRRLVHCFRSCSSLRCRPSRGMPPHTSQGPGSAARPLSP